MCPSNICLSPLSPPPHQPPTTTAEVTLTHPEDAAVIKASALERLRFRRFILTVSKFYKSSQTRLPTVCLITANGSGILSFTQEDEGDGER